MFVTVGSDGDFELTAEMLIHGDLDDESTLSEEEEIYEGDSDELDQLQDVSGGVGVYMYMYVCMVWSDV